MLSSWLYLPMFFFFCTNFSLVQIFLPFFFFNPEDLLRLPTFSLLGLLASARNGAALEILYFLPFCPQRDYVQVDIILFKNECSQALPTSDLSCGSDGHMIWIPKFKSRLTRSWANAQQECRVISWLRMSISLHGPPPWVPSANYPF